MKWLNETEYTIVDMKWERIFLEFTIETNKKTDEVTFAFAQFSRPLLNKKEVQENGACPQYEFRVKQKIPVEYDRFENGSYTFSVNMAAVSGREFLDNGQWSLCAFTKDGASVVHMTNELGYRLDDLSRVFRYGRNKYAYNVSFSLKNFDGENLELILNSYFLIVNKDWKKRRYIKEAVTWDSRFRRVYMYMAVWLIRIFYHTFERIMPKDGTRILFMTETKDYLWGNLKYIDARIRERGLDQKFRLSYSCRKAVGHHNSILSWMKTVYRIAQQDYIFIDDYAPVFEFFNLSPRTKLIQVWHAGEGFKSVGYSRFGKDGSPFPCEACHKKYDYALTGSKRLIKVYEEVFGIEKSAFLPTGMARLDDFLEEQKIASFKDDFYQQYPELKEKKVILFAPTFRGTGQKTAYYDYDKLDLKRIYEFCGEEWVFLVKMHPFVEKPIAIPEEYRGRIRDFASYPNINDLYYITDVLITDYSSNYYEYALLKKPVLFYTYDREFYELTRGVHRDVKSHAPGRVCDTFDELMEALEQEEYGLEKLLKFTEENFGEYDGHAADRVIDQILLGRT